MPPRPTERDLSELREKRLAANEVFFRELNEKLEAQGEGSDTLVVLCECANEDCAQRLELTRRETEVARLVSFGSRNKEIARELDISEGTVKMHLHNLYEKLKVTSRTELAILVRDKGLS